MRDALWPLMRAGLFRLDPEVAHGVSIQGLKSGLVPGVAPPSDPRLAVRVAGLTFPNPLGLAAGYDKNAEVPGAILKLGFGFTEIGSVTPRPQEGNPKPRLYRLVADEGVINRFGFNNEGHEPALRRLKEARPSGIVGVNIGANKDAADRVADYAQGIRTFYSVASYFTANVSSPNTPGLRNLQGREELDALLKRLQPLQAQYKTPLLVKIAPDLADEDIDAVAELALSYGLNGIVASNTTIARADSLRSRNKAETGGLSGAPLFEKSTEVLRRLYDQVGDRITLIGVGGVSSGEQAYAKIRAGASAVQLYSALVYEGPALIGRVRTELAALLKRDGFKSVSDAVGRK